MADATKDSDSLGEERLEKWKAYKRLSPKPYENTKLPEKPPPLGSKIIAVQTEKAQSVPEVHRKVPKVTAPLDENQRRKKLLCLFREFVAHCVFVILVTIVAFGRINPIMYYFGDALHRLFTTKVFYDEHVKMTTFQDINTVDEFWKYLRGDFLDMLFMNFDKETPNRFEDALIILQNALIGAVRIRQVRVRNDSCTVPDAFRGDFPGCYHYYSKDGEDKEPYGLNEGTAWTYNEPSTLGSGWYNGRISWYGGGGYYVDLFNNLEECNQALEDLWNNTWIDRGTRAVFIDFTAYSPNVNLFCSARLVAEFPPCGGVLTDSDFSTLQLLRYLNWWDILMLPFEICFMLMVFGFTILFFVRVCCLEKLRTPFKWWHFVELSILFASYVTIGTSLYLMLIVDDRLKLAYEALEMDKHYSFEHLVKIQWITNISVGFLVFFVMIKFLKFMPLTGITNRLYMSFVQCLRELQGLIPVLVVVFTAFAELGYILFGFQVEEFSTMWKSFTTLFLVTVGQFDYQKIEEADRIMAFFYFPLYIIVVLLFLVSMFIAATVYGFAKVNRMYDNLSYPQGFLSNITLRFCVKFLKTFGCKKSAKRIEDKARAREHEKRYLQVRGLLARAGFNDAEIDSFFKKYGIKWDKPIDPAIVERMTEDTKGDKSDLDVKKHQELIAQLNQLSATISTVSRTTTVLAEKLDLIVDLLLKEQ